jgi:microcystin-dependent protein
MSVPVPVNISIGKPPVGWTAQSPDLFKDLASLVASLLSGTITASFLTGQIGGAAPTSDIGPWQNGNEWWFWDPSVTPHQYWPSQQGAPVGSVMMWGTQSDASVPARWLLCAGQSVPIATYPRLYNAIGHTWGGSSSTTFKLPPAAMMFLNAPNWFPPNDPHQDYSHSPDGSVNVRGGWEVATLSAQNLPAAKISMPVINAKLITGNNNQPNIQSTGSSYLYPVTDESGKPLGAGQQNISVMPPFVVVHYVIKYM